jgi:hypothetical protein
MERKKKKHYRERNICVRFLGSNAARRRRRTMKLLPVGQQQKKAYKN